MGTFPKRLITYLKCRILNAMDNVVNVVVGAVVDASVYAFAAQTVIVLFASLDVIFNANLFHLAFWKWHNKEDNPHKSLCFILFCPAGLSSW